MAIDPNQIELSSEQQHRLAVLAEQTGKDWSELVDELLGSVQVVQSASVSTTSESNGKGLQDKTLFEVLSERGILGCFDGPTDLSWNPKHMEGFGEPRYPKNPG